MTTRFWLCKKLQLLVERIVDARTSVLRQDFKRSQLSINSTSYEKQSTLNPTSLGHKLHLSNLFVVIFRRLFAQLGQMTDGSKIGQSLSIFTWYFLAHFCRCRPLFHDRSLIFFTHKGQRIFPVELFRLEELDEFLELFVADDGLPPDGAVDS